MQRSVLVGLCVYGVMFRVLPYLLTWAGMPLDVTGSWYPANFSPLMSLSVFAGATQAGRAKAWGLPLLILVISDLGIIALSGHVEWVVNAISLMIYGGFALGVGCGRLLFGRARWLSGIGIGVVGELLFFVVTNFGTWLVGDGTGGAGTYPLTLAGLVDCYIQALPFLQRSVMSTAVFSAVLFSPWMLAQTNSTVAVSTKSELPAAGEATI